MTFTARKMRTNLYKSSQMSISITFYCDITEENISAEMYEDMWVLCIWFHSLSDWQRAHVFCVNNGETGLVQNGSAITVCVALLKEGARELSSESRIIAWVIFSPSYFKGSLQKLCRTCLGGWRQKGGQIVEWIFKFGFSNQIKTKAETNPLRFW
jgi:hypothetical protein